MWFCLWLCILQQHCHWVNLMLAVKSDSIRTQFVPNVHQSSHCHYQSVSTRICLGKALKMFYKAITVRDMNKSSILRIVCKWTAFKNVHYPPSPHLRSHRNVVNDVIKCVKQQLKFPPHNLKMIPTGLCFIKDAKNPLHFRWTQFTVLISFYISRKIPAICLQLLSLYIFLE